MIRKNRATDHFRRAKYLFLALLAPLLLRADLINTSDTVMILKNMGSSVNTAGDEFYPTITADGKTMVFSLRPQNGENSDIFMSNFKSGAWSRPVPVRELNTTFDDQTPFISADGNFILFSSNRESALRPPKSEGVYYLTNDLYISRREGGRWTDPEWIDGDVNTVDNERAPSLSRDGKTLYFSRYRGNSLEKSVIYQAKLGAQGFGDVRPLPAPINSGYSDFALMPSNNKPGFYFSSSRPGGRGLWDIYYVHYIDNKFSDPINLGAPTNSEFNDLTVTEIGNVIYFCSDRDGGKGSTDIYTILLSPKIFRVPDTGFKFTATEKESGRAVSASFKVTMRSADTKKKKSEKLIEKKSGTDGRFDVKIDAGVTEVLVASSDSRYMPYSKSFTPVAGEMKKALIKLGKLAVKAPEPVEELIVEAEPPAQDYRPVYFNSGSARIRMKDMPYLREIAKKLRSDDALCLRLTGHADSVGRESNNQRLSVRRAAAVKSALMHFGVSRYRFSVAGKGESEPSLRYKDTGKRLYNRRVEFTVIDREQVDDDEAMP